MAPFNRSGGTRARTVDRAVIEAAYRGLLRRDPAAAEVEHHRNAIGVGGWTREDALFSIATSVEASAQFLYSDGLRNLAHSLQGARAAARGYRPVHFLHIMKTGGTALTVALQAIRPDWPAMSGLFLDHVVCIPRPVLHQAMLVAGHLPFEATRLLPPDVAVCTVMRDPVHRTLSHYAHVRDHGEPDLTITEFVASPRWRPSWENYQARHLVHEIGILDAPISPYGRIAEELADLVAAHSLPLQSLFDLTPISVAPRDLLATALARLEAIDLVGTTGDLQAVCDQVARFWDAESPRVARHRATPEPVRSLDPGLRREICDGTTVDAALYERALEFGRERYDAVRS